MYHSTIYTRPEPRRFRQTALPLIGALSRLLRAPELLLPLQLQGGVYAGGATREKVAGQEDHQSHEAHSGRHQPGVARAGLEEKDGGPTAS